MGQKLLGTTTLGALLNLEYDVANYASFSVSLGGDLTVSVTGTTITLDADVDLSGGELTCCYISDVIAGTPKSIQDFIALTNTGNAADMDGTGTAILFQQYYYDVATPDVANSGKIVVGTETDWTSVAGTQDSYMAFYTALDGVVSEKARINSAGVLSGISSLGVTGTRIANGYFTDLAVTNPVAGSITGNAATVTVADTSSATCYVGLYEAASGSLAAKTDAALTYNASTGALSATSMGVATGRAFTYNAISAVSAITAKNDWNFGSGGNLSMTAEQVVCIGPSAGAAVTTTGYSVYLGYSAASNVVGAYGNNVIIGCIAARDATSIKNSVVSGYAAGIGMNGDYNTAIGVSAGRYYGAGTDQNVSATQCVYLGGLSRAYASGDTNEIVIGYNAIGAGSNTATLGNTSITSTVLRGAVSATSFDATAALTGASSTLTTAGVAKSVTDVLTITNSAPAADMDGTGTAILWNQWYYDAVTPAIADAGRVTCVAETDWTSTANTQKSYLGFETCFEGTVAERWRIASSGALSNTAALGTAYLHIEAGTATASTAPLKFTDGVLLATAEEGAEELDVGTRWMTPISTQREAVVGCGCAQYEAFHVTHSE
jgi:hypothetical protein